jgi:ParB-like chromosome segregation protein Spo0J
MAKEIPISRITVGPRHRKDMGDLESLAASMEACGLLQPVAVRPDLMLVAGARRIKAALMLGWDRIAAHVVHDLTEELDLLQAERDENTCRKDFTPSEAVAIKRDIEDRLREAAKERQREGQKRGGATGGRGRSNRQVCEESAQTNGDAGKSRNQIAAAVGLSHDTLKKATAVVEAEESDPERFGPIREQMDRTGNVHAAYRKVQEFVSPAPAPLPPRHPHSDVLLAWLRLVQGQTLVVRVEQGGIRAMLAERDKWDWREVRGYLLPMLRDMEEVIGEFRKEIERAAQKG